MKKRSEELELDKQASAKGCSSFWQGSDAGGRGKEEEKEEEGEEGEEVEMVINVIYICLY